TTCIWLVIAVIHTGSVNLTKWVAYVPCRGKFAQSIQPTFRTSNWHIKYFNEAMGLAEALTR
ncbi:MAG TPA: hypothetical protein V6C46_00005, partial [Coleofasciculaceae cyanobacterium]